MPSSLHSSLGVQEECKGHHRSKGKGSRRRLFVHGPEYSRVPVILRGHLRIHLISSIDRKDPLTELACLSTSLFSQSSIMLSLFPRPNRFTLDTRRDHIAERDRALCYPSTSASSPSDLPSSEIDIQAGDQEILSCGLEELAQAIASSRWTSEQVCLAFIRSSRRAQKAINCITVPNYQAAIARARQLDQHLKETGKTVGTFHGIPFSFKENNNIKGLTTTVGYTAWVLDGPAKEDAALARMVQHLGGVIIVKTNIPQTMMSFECFNPLYDRTLNPWSPAHGPGGSSGGEAALLGADGAVAGFGSDIGGSLRIPTGYCGIYALKPTAGRFPSAGAKSARAGFDGIVSVFGPMTRSSADLEFLSRSLIELIHPNVDSSLDPWAAQDRFGCEELRASPLRPAWLDPIKVASSRDGDHKRIRMGYYYCDGFTQTSPACIRAVQESIEALKASEHAGRYEFIEVDPNRLRAKEAMHIFLSNVTADNFNGLLGPLRLGRIKEAMDFALFLPVFSTRAPRWARGLFRWVVQYVVKDPHLSYMLSAGGAKSAEGYMQQIARRKEFEKQFIKDIWKFYQLDGIIW